MEDSSNATKCPIEEQFNRIIRQEDSQKVPSTINALLKKLISQQSPAENVAKLLNLVSNLNQKAIPSIYISDAYNYMLSDAKSGVLATESMIIFFSKKIIPCDRSLTKLLDFLVQNDLLDCVQAILSEFIKGEFYRKYRLSDCCKALVAKKQFEFLLINFAKCIPLDSVNGHVWEELIERCCEKIEYFQLIKQHFFQYVAATHPNTLQNIEARVEQFLGCMLTYKYKPEQTAEIIFFATSLKLRIQGKVIRDLFLYFIATGFSFQKILAIIQTIKYTLDAFSFTQLLSKLIEIDKQFELFCLIEICLNDQTLCFTFNDINFSTSQLQYVIIQQSYFNQLLIQIQNDKPKDPIADLSFHSSASDQENYIWECLSLASNSNSMKSEHYEKIIKT